MARKIKKKKIDRNLKRMKTLRKYWTISPVTRIKPNKKKKSRAKIKQELRKKLKEG